DNPLAIDHAVRRILLLHSIILSIGGIPLLYLGDEWATVNDYRYMTDEAQANDSRWVHRPQFDWAGVALAQAQETIQGRVFQGLQRLVNRRQQLPALANGRTVFVETGNSHVLGYTRHDQILVLVNFSEHEQLVTGGISADIERWLSDGQDLITRQNIIKNDALVLTPYQVVWLMSGSDY
ncbi:amylosucrase, partial [Chloroflexota bacterium]